MAFVTYLRVSTQRQGASGLGLEAQQEAVANYAGRVNEAIIATFVEVESGGQNYRPELTAALKLCRQQRAVLLIARLDRLSRSLSFVAQLLDANVEIRAADMPEANRMMLQMLAVFAEHERRLIGQRTKAALAAAKARGVILGRNGCALAAKNKLEAQAFAESVRSEVEAICGGRAVSLQSIALALNHRGVRPRGGGQWHPTSVRRVLARLAG